MSALSEKIRAEMKKNDDLRDAGLVTPEDVVRYDDIVYGESGKWQVLDVYRPKGMAGKKLPVIVSVHGGGWIYGDKERYQYYCMSLAQRGFAVVNFTYRLAPEYQFPCSLEDTNLVFGWTLAHGEEYGFDTEHIFGVGDSAGAHILGLYTAVCTNPAYAGKYPFQPPEGFVPTAVALNCGAYHILLDRTEDLSVVLRESYLPGHGSPEELALLQVLPQITDKYPPVFVMTAVGDFLKSDAALLQERLTACDVPHISRLYGDRKNRLGHVFHVNIRLPEAERCNDEECGFFRAFCRKA